MFKRDNLAINKYDSTMDSTALLASRIDYDANGNPTHLGLAAAGVTNGEEGWMIRKVIYDGNQRPTALLFAEGTVDFDKVWNDRTTYTFL